MTNELGLEAFEAVTQTTDGARTRNRWTTATRVFGALGAGVALIVAAGCGSSTTDPYPDVQHFCVAKANAECKVASVDCVVTISDCLTAREATCNVDAQQAESEGRKYDSAQVPACLSAVDSAYSDNGGNLSATDITNFTNLCERVYVGAAAANDACTDDYDCAGSLVCDPIRKACGTYTPTAGGAACNNPGQVCDTGFYCGGTAGSVSGLRSCIARVPVGATCSDQILCLEGNYCDGDVCVPALETGSVCTADDQCVTNDICDPYASTNGQSKCDTGIRFAAGAASCNAYSTSTESSGGDTVPMTSDAGSTTPVLDASSPADAATGG